MLTAECVGMKTNFWSGKIDVATETEELTLHSMCNCISFQSDFPSKIVARAQVNSLDRAKKRILQKCQREATLHNAHFVSLFPMYVFLISQNVDNRYIIYQRSGSFFLLLLHWIWKSFLSYSPSYLTSIRSTRIPFFLLFFAHLFSILFSLFAFHFDFSSGIRYAWNSAIYFCFQESPVFFMSHWFLLIIKFVPLSRNRSMHFHKNRKYHSWIVSAVETGKRPTKKLSQNGFSPKIIQSHIRDANGSAFGWLVLYKASKTKRGKNM